ARHVPGAGSCARVDDARVPGDRQRPGRHRRRRPRREGPARAAALLGEGGGLMASVIAGASAVRARSTVTVRADALALGLLGVLAVLLAIVTWETWGALG